MERGVSLSRSERPTTSPSPEIENQGHIVTLSFGYFLKDIDLPSRIVLTVFLTKMI
jgi:hypothetical protein